MGLGGINIWSLLIILVIVLLLFGTKRLKNLGGDLGSAIKGFKNAMTDEEKAAAEKEAEDKEQQKVEQQKTAVEEPAKAEDKVEK